LKLFLISLRKIDNLLFQLAFFFNYYYIICMTKRTYERDAILIERADDLENIVKDKREIWRSNASKANRRQRRYKKRLISELLKYDR